MLPAGKVVVAAPPMPLPTRVLTAQQRLGRPGSRRLLRAIEPRGDESQVPRQDRVGPHDVRHLSERLASELLADVRQDDEKTFGVWWLPPDAEGQLEGAEAVEPRQILRVVVG